MMKLKSIRTQQEAGKAFSMNEAPTTSNNTSKQRTFPPTTTTMAGKPA